MKEMLERELASLDDMPWTTPHLSAMAHHIRELLRLMAERDSECRCGKKKAA